MTVLQIVLQKLQENGFTVNPLKCEWTVKETDWLGYWLTLTDLKPWRNNIDAIFKMQPHTSLKLLCGFVGMVNYYRDMWPRRSEILAPLTAHTGTPKKSLPIAYYSKKLNSAQMNYVTIDKELLCVIATLREFRSMLLGAELHIHTNHNNILNVGDSSKQCLRWILYFAEYSPKLHYVEGPHNMIVNTFSRLSRQDDTSALVGKKVITEDSELASHSLF